MQARGAPSAGMVCSGGGENKIPQVKNKILLVLKFTQHLFYTTP